MGDVVDLAEHREEPGTMWFAGILKCVFCAVEHVAVVPMPSWAQCPLASECTGCHKFGAIPVHDDFKDDPTRHTPWADLAKDQEPPSEAMAEAEAFLPSIEPAG